MHTQTRTEIPEKSNPEAVVEREFHLQPVPSGELEAAVASLRGAAGIEEVVPLKGGRPALRLRYDTRELDASHIREMLLALGLRPAEGLWERFRLGWMNMLDTNIRDNASRRPAAC